MYSLREPSVTLLISLFLFIQAWIRQCLKNARDWLNSRRGLTPRSLRYRSLVHHCPREAPRNEADAL